MKKYGQDHWLGGEASSNPILTLMIGVGAEEYNSNIGNNEIAAIAGTVMVP